MSRQPAANQLHGASKGTSSTVTPAMADDGLRRLVRFMMLPIAACPPRLRASRSLGSGSLTWIKATPRELDLDEAATTADIAGGRRDRGRQARNRPEISPANREPPQGPTALEGLAPA